MKKIIIAGLIGAVTLFIWSSVSHMALGWHESYTLRFNDEDAITAILSKECPEAGIYALPNPVMEGLSSEEATAAWQAAVKQHETGITFFGAVGKKSGNSFGKMLTIQFLNNCFCFLIIAMLLCCQGPKPFLHRVLFVELVALLAFVGFMVPLWSWYGFSGTYILVNLFDTLIGWGLPGAMTALVFKRSESG